MSSKSTLQSLNQSDKPTEFFDQYWKHASALRNWFVVYGVGGIALLFTKTTALESAQLKIKIAIIASFFVAVLAQVILAFINKWTHWCIYRGGENKEFRGTFSYKIASVLSDCVWIDFIIDLICLFAFAVATLLILYNLASSAQNSVLSTPSPNDTISIVTF